MCISSTKSLSINVLNVMVGTTDLLLNDYSGAVNMKADEIFSWNPSFSYHFSSDLSGLYQFDVVASSFFCDLKDVLFRSTGQPSML